MCQPEGPWAYDESKKALFPTFEVWVEAIRSTHYPEVEPDEISPQVNPETSNAFYGALFLTCTAMGVSYVHLTNALQKEPNRSKEMFFSLARTLGQKLSIITPEHLDYGNIVDIASDMTPAKGDATLIESNDAILAEAAWAGALSAASCLSSTINTKCSSIALTEHDHVTPLDTVFEYFEFAQSKPCTYAGHGKLYSQERLMAANTFLHICAGGHAMYDIRFRYTVVDLAKVSNKSVHTAINFAHDAEKGPSTRVGAYKLQDEYTQIGVIIDTSEYTFIEKLMGLNPSVEGIADLRQGLNKWMAEYQQGMSSTFQYVNPQVHLCNLQATYMAYNNEVTRTALSLSFMGSSDPLLEDTFFMPEVSIDLADAPFFKLTAKIS